MRASLEKSIFILYSNQLKKYDLICDPLIIGSLVPKQQIHCMIVLTKINSISASKQTAVEMEVINE